MAINYYTHNQSLSQTTGNHTSQIYNKPVMPTTWKEVGKGKQSSTRIKYKTLNPFQSNFYANRVLPSSYLFWAPFSYKHNRANTTHKTHGLPRNRKSTTCAICWLKSVLNEEKRRTGSNSGAGGPQTQQKRVGRLPTSEQNRKIIMSDEVRRRIGKG
jgi:hypothetical protein